MLAGGGNKLGDKGKVNSEEGDQIRGERGYWKHSRRGQIKKNPDTPPPCLTAHDETKRTVDPARVSREERRGTANDKAGQPWKLYSSARASVWLNSAASLLEMIKGSVEARSGVGFRDGEGRNGNLEGGREKSAERNRPYLSSRFRLGPIGDVEFSRRPETA